MMGCRAGHGGATQYFSGFLSVQIMKAVLQLAITMSSVLMVEFSEHFILLHLHISADSALLVAFL